MSPDDIHQIALTGEEWRDHAQTFCENSGLAVDDLITQLLNAGLTIEELGHLEWLSDPDVLRWVPSAQLPSTTNADRRRGVPRPGPKCLPPRKNYVEIRQPMELNGRPYVRRFRAETALMKIRLRPSRLVIASPRQSTIRERLRSPSDRHQ